MKTNSKILPVLALILAGTLLIYASGCTAVAKMLEISLETGGELPAQASSGLPQSIVILTGPSDWSRAMARVSRAAELHRRTGVPIMICGNGAHVFEQVLQGRHGMRSKWIEAHSMTTMDNARRCSPILRRDNVSRIFLVTDQYHMRRARMVFERNALNVVPAPSSALSDSSMHISDFSPSHEGWQRVSIALHELIGIAWYMIRH